MKKIEEYNCHFCGDMIPHGEHYACFDDTEGSSGYYCSEFCYKMEQGVIK